MPEFKAAKRLPGEGRFSCQLTDFEANCALRDGVAQSRSSEEAKFVFGIDSRLNLMVDHGGTRATTPSSSKSRPTHRSSLGAPGGDR